MTNSGSSQKERSRRRKGRHRSPLGDSGRAICAAQATIRSTSQKTTYRALHPSKVSHTGPTNCSNSHRPKSDSIGPESIAAFGIRLPLVFPKGSTLQGIGSAFALRLCSEGFVRLFHVP